MPIVRNPQPALVFFETNGDINKSVESIRTSRGYLLSVKELEEIALYCQREIQEIDQEGRDEINKQWRVEEVEEMTRQAISIKGERPPKAERNVFVYLLKDRHRGFIKIGITHNMKDRLKQLKTANPSIDLIRYYKGTDTDEQNLHGHFKQLGKRVDGEWFTLGNADFQYIESYFQSKHATQ